MDIVQELESMPGRWNRASSDAVRHLLERVLDGPDGSARLLSIQSLDPAFSQVHRLRFLVDGKKRGIILKRLRAVSALKVELLTRRWLPAAGLSSTAPALLGVAAEQSGDSVWHAYEDLGDRPLGASRFDRQRVDAAARSIAELHACFAEHPLLPECRLYGGDRGMAFYSGNVRDAIRSLDSLRPPTVRLSAAMVAIRDSLLTRMERLFAEEAVRAQALAESGDVETLLHGDLWTMNIFVADPSERGTSARLIDWDGAAVGPMTYDVSTFLLRFPMARRYPILQEYRMELVRRGRVLPASTRLNLLFETAELARYASRIAWPALAILLEGAEWGSDTLAEIDRWFRDLRPVLPVMGGHVGITA